MSIQNLMTQRCDIYRKSSVAEDGYGITSNTFIKVASSVKCHIQQISRLSSYYRQYVSGISDKMYFIGYYKPSANIHEGDRVEWEGYKMVVLAVPPSIGRYGTAHHKEAFMELQDK